MDLYLDLVPIILFKKITINLIQLCSAVLLEEFQYLELIKNSTIQG